MNKTFIRIALAAIVTINMPSDSFAQSNILGNLKNVATQAASKVVSDKTGNSTLGNIVSNLLGTSKVTEASIVGTWTYSEPCLVAESKNVLSNVAATAATTKAQEMMKQGLTKAGITAGKMKLEFAQDKTLKITAGKKVINATYALSGSDLSVTFKNLKKTVKMNCKVNAGNLQLAMDSKKLLTVVNAVAAQASQASAAIGSVGTLLNSVDGLYTGLQFTKN